MTHHNHPRNGHTHITPAEQHAAALRQADLIAAMAIDHAVVEAVLGTEHADPAERDTVLAVWTLARWIGRGPVPLPLLLAVTAQRMPWQGTVAVAAVTGLAILAQAAAGHRRASGDEHTNPDTEHRRAA